LGQDIAELLKAERDAMERRGSPKAGEGVEDGLTKMKDTKSFPLNASVSNVAAVEAVPKIGAKAVNPQHAERVQEIHAAALPALKNRFSQIYEKNTWGKGRGFGSRPNNNIEYIQFVQKFMLHNPIKTVVDLGCGDWQFSRFINWEGISYSGFDIVKTVIETNKNIYAKDNIRFSLFDSLKDLPQADLLLCKDVLQHLPNELIKQYLSFFRTRFKAMLITNDDYPEEIINRDIQIGGWRTLRLEREPFLERASIVKAWAVLDGPRTTRKVTYILYGDA
jgi:SAM-dependent methyltransferase